MRVAVYHPWIYLKSGLERTLMELKRRSRHQWTLYTSHFDAEGTYPELREMGVREVQRVSVQRRYSAVLQAAWRIVNTRLPEQEFDALVISCEGLGSLMNFRNHRRPLLCLCFTPLRAVYDAEYRRRHVAKHRLLRPLVWLAEAGFRVLDRLAWRHYRRVFCITRTVRQRVLDGGLCAPDQVEVAYAGISAERIAASDTFERFFFLPGRIMWTKNIELGLDAFRHFAATPEGQGFALVVAGMVDRKSQPYFESLRARAADMPQVQFRTDLSDAEMEDLYRRCHALLFTAFNEDQGLTPLEGATKGKTVVAVNRGGPTETVVHGHTGLLVEPEPQAFAQAMGQLVANPALNRRLGAAALEHCRQFTWSAFVERIDCYLDELEGAPR